jgi:hypothetical protein
MQLTKDDVKIDVEISAEYLYENKGMKKYLDFSKFQQVVEFYEENIIEDTEEEYSGALIMMMKKNPELFKKFSKQYKLSWNDWLFNYCFKQGLQ